MHTLTKTIINADKISIKKTLNYADVNIVSDTLLYCRDILNIDISKHKTLLNEVIKHNEPYKISQLDISGKDLTALGLSGKEVGEKLEFLLDEVIKKPELNTKEKLLKLICN